MASSPGIPLTSRHGNGQLLGKQLVHDAFSGELGQQLEQIEDKLLEPLADHLFLPLAQPLADRRGVETVIAGGETTQQGVALGGHVDRSATDGAHREIPRIGRARCQIFSNS
jgi:hypothetical protein